MQSLQLTAKELEAQEKEFRLFDKHAKLYLDIEPKINQMAAAFQLWKEVGFRFGERLEAKPGIRYWFLQHHYFAYDSIFNPTGYWESFDPSEERELASYTRLHHPMLAAKHKSVTLCLSSFNFDELSYHFIEEKWDYREPTLPLSQENAVNFRLIAEEHEKQLLSACIYCDPPTVWIQPWSYDHYKINFRRGGSYIQEEAEPGERREVLAFLPTTLDPEFIIANACAWLLTEDSRYSFQTYQIEACNGILEPLTLPYKTAKDLGPSFVHTPTVSFVKSLLSSQEEQFLLNPKSSTKLSPIPS